MKKGENVAELANTIISLIEKIMGKSGDESNYEVLRQVAADPDGKWARYADQVIRDSDPKILSSFLLNAAYEGGFRGFKTSEEASKEYQCNIPRIVLMDPTSA